MEYRTIAAIALSILVLLGFQYFFAPEGTPPSSVTQEGLEQKTAGSSVVNAGPAVQQLQAAVSSEEPQSSASPAKDAKKIRVETEKYVAVFTEKGAMPVSFRLKDYHDSMSPSSEQVDLIKVPPEHYPLFVDFPQHRMSDQVCEADKDGVNVTGSQDASLVFTCRISEKLSVTKTYTFHGNSFWMDMHINASDNIQPPTVFLDALPVAKANSYVFTGTSYSSNGRFSEVDLDKVGKGFSFSGQIDWVGFGDNYFLSAIVPKDQAVQWKMEVVKKNEEGENQLSMTPQSTKPEGILPLDLGIYMGPKRFEHLQEQNYHLEKAINFGWFDVIAKPLLYAVLWLYNFIPNYGVVIILITILIKLVFWPLSHQSTKSMKTMQKLQPKLEKIKEKYGNDKEAMNRELMQLYKTYKVNPMGGCLPMLVQIPVFFALYKVLLQSIELRHAPFMLWINDLSAPDRLMIPGFDIPFIGGIPVLTLLMGVSMYFQQKMTTTTTDPTQAMIFKFMPVIFTVMFVSFPSGLVLYWFINNILSMAQQYYTNKFVA